MEVIYLLIPGMIFLGLVMVGVLVWAVKNGQYEDLEGDAQRILMDEDDPLLPEPELSEPEILESKLLEPKSPEPKSPEPKSLDSKKEPGKNWPDADDETT